MMLRQAGSSPNRARRAAGIPRPFFAALARPGAVASRFVRFCRRFGSGAGRVGSYSSLSQRKMMCPFIAMTPRRARNDWVVSPRSRRFVESYRLLSERLSSLMNDSMVWRSYVWVSSHSAVP